MKSEVITFRNDETSREDVLYEAEAIVVIKRLTHKEAMHLRLLAEEMVGMFLAVVGDVEAQFWIEDTGNCFELHLTSDTKLYKKAMRELLSLSSSGVNEAARGILGKIRIMFITALRPEDEFMEQARNFMLGMTGAEGDSAQGLGVNNYYWSLNRYKSNVESHKDENEKASEAWDELEKSVIANLADEVKVGVQGDKVEMIVYMNYTPQEEES